PATEDGRHPHARVAALGAPMVALGRATRHPWRMWGAGRVAADDGPGLEVQSSERTSPVRRPARIPRRKP
ncbi:MAG: hypothetical protein ACRDV6_10210, partial [Acidimicrobiales bacterium]